MVTFIVLIVVVIMLLFYLVSIYNSLVKLMQQTKEAWSDISVQLKRRYDLIPNLVETVKGYATHEQSVFEDVTKARADALNAQGGNVADQVNAENTLSTALKSLFAVSENYPDLKATQNFQQLQSALVDIETTIQASRRFYNGSVRDLNSKIQMFPSSIVAGMYHFQTQPFFELESQQEAEPVKVDFSK